ncbi:MAG: outer membrane lipoprotein LolB [Rhodocyclales bacterium]|nr:outer membrane lipoprotein LolB [Rhodocyclales bacterium]
MWRRLVCLVAVFALAACAELGPVRNDTMPALGPALERFAADGRISLRQGDRSDHLQFDWQHAPGRDVVLFSSPLGQGLAELGREAGAAWLKLPGKPAQRAADLPTLAQQVFGVALPLDVLAEWLGGARPQPEGEVDGWQIMVTESAPYRERRLPRRIEIRRDDIELKIVVTGWGEND